MIYLCFSVYAITINQTGADIDTNRNNPAVDRSRALANSIISVCGRSDCSVSSVFIESNSEPKLILLGFQN